MFVLEGTPTLVTDVGEIELKPGMCAGFAAGGRAHHIVNRSSIDAVFLEIGDRTPGDEGEFPADNIRAVLRPVEALWVCIEPGGLSARKRPFPSHFQWPADHFGVAVTFPVDPAKSENAASTGCGIAMTPGGGKCQSATGLRKGAPAVSLERAAAVPRA